MAIQTFNSANGFSVGNQTIVIDDNGNVAANTLTVSADANVTGNITADYFIGNGSELTDLPVAAIIANGTSNVSIAAADSAITFAVNGANVGNISSTSVAIGYLAGDDTQGTLSVAVGVNAGSTAQGTTAVAIGNAAATANQGLGAVAVGSGSGNDTQGVAAVAVGLNSGVTTQGSGAVAVGGGAGTNTQGNTAVAIGSDAGSDTQGEGAIAIGAYAGFATQGLNSIAIGLNTAGTAQGENSIAIGQNAGQANQGINSVAIGAFAGETDQPTNSIIINASGATLDGTESGLYIDPVRNDTGNTTNVVYYNTTTKEVTYGPAPVSYGDSNVSTYLASGTNTDGFSSSGNITLGGTGSPVTLQDFSSTPTQVTLGWSPSISPAPFSTGDTVLVEGGSGVDGSWTVVSCDTNGVTIDCDLDPGTGFYTDLPGPTVSLVYISTITASGDISGANLIATGGISAGGTIVSNGDITTAGGNVIAGEVQTPSLVVNGTSNLGAVANVTITGGTAGQVLTTDGSNVLSWTTVSGGSSNSISNGTTSVSIPTSDGNIVFTRNNIVSGTIRANSVSIGANAGLTSQNSNSVAIGANAGSNTQSSSAVAIGLRAGSNTQGSSTVAIGPDAGTTSQGTRSVAIGSSAGSTSQGSSAVAIGRSAGSDTQGSQSVAIGLAAGSDFQSISAVAIGSSAGSISQGTNSIAIGLETALQNQGGNAIAIGYSAGRNTQGANTVAIGYNAGSNTQGANSIAIGYNAGSGTVAAQPAGSIAIVATGVDMNPTNAGLYIAPVRNDTGNTTNAVFYNTTTKELTYGLSSGGSYGNANVSAYLSSGTDIAGYSTIGNIQIGTTGDTLSASEYSSTSTQVTISWQDLYFPLPFEIGQTVLISGIVAPGPVELNGLWTLTDSNSFSITFDTTLNPGSGSFGFPQPTVTRNILRSLSATGNISAAYILGNISAATGLGNVSTINLNGNASTVLSGAGTFIEQSGGGGGVTSIVAGTGITIDPVGGTGAVTVNYSGGTYTNSDVQTFLNGAGFSLFEGPLIVSGLTPIIGGALASAPVVIANYAEVVADNGDDSGTLLIEPSLGTIQRYTLTGNITINGFVEAVAGTNVTLVLTQDATGGRTLTSTMKFLGGVKTLSTAPNAIDVLSVFYDGVNYLATLGQGYA
jgi:hypothetical protein